MKATTITITSLTLLLTVASVPGQTFTVLHKFTITPDGTTPTTGLLLSSNKLFGSTTSGGISNYGTIFSLNTDGSGFTVLDSITNSLEGNEFNQFTRFGDVLLTTAQQGGTNGIGWVISASADGNQLTPIHVFHGVDGALSEGGLALGGNRIYGTTVAGGSNNYGVVFAMGTDGSDFIVLHSFSDASSFLRTNSDGAAPQGGLVLSGNTLYGTTCAGGAGGCGNIFSVGTDGSNFTDLYDFYEYNIDDPNPPSFTEATLVISGSTLYGTTRLGGDNDNGCVFSIQTSGSNFTVLHSFSAFDFYGSTENAEGALPEAGVILAGNLLFGTTSYGGTNGRGTVYMLKTDGTGFLNLHSFTGGSDGAQPVGDLAFSGNTVYGAAFSGGITNYGGAGTLFSVNIGPGISGLQVNAGNLTISGNNGLAGQTYALLTSTNPGTPINQWRTIATSTPTNSGNFSITIARSIGAADPPTFFALRMQ